MIQAPLSAPNTMVKISASIDICSDSYSLADLSLMTGIQAGAGSHDKGAPRVKGGPWTQSILRIDSRIPRESSAKAHLEDLMSQYVAFQIGLKMAGNEGIGICVNLGVMFSTACMSLEIDEQDLLMMAQNKMRLEISAYPSL